MLFLTLLPLRLLPPLQKSLRTPIIPPLSAVASIISLSPQSHAMMPSMVLSLFITSIRLLFNVNLHPYLPITNDPTGLSVEMSSRTSNMVQKWLSYSYFWWISWNQLYPSQFWSKNHVPVLSLKVIGLLLPVPIFSDTVIHNLCGLPKLMPIPACMLWALHGTV